MLQSAPSTAPIDVHAEYFNDITALEHGLSHLYKAAMGKDAGAVEEMLEFFTPKECHAAMTMTGNSANGESAFGVALSQKDSAVMGVFQRSTTKELWEQALKQEQDKISEREASEERFNERKFLIVLAVKHNDCTRAAEILEGLRPDEKLRLITHDYGDRYENGTKLHFAIGNMHIDRGADADARMADKHMNSENMLDVLIKGLDSSQILQAITKKCEFPYKDYTKRSVPTVSKVISPLSYALELSGESIEVRCSIKKLSEKLEPDHLVSALSASLPYSLSISESLLFDRLDSSQTIRAMTPPNNDNTLLHIIMDDLSINSTRAFHAILEKIKDAPKDEVTSFLNRMNKDGDTVLDIAYRKRSDDTISALKGAGATEVKWTSITQRTGQDLVRAAAHAYSQLS